MRVPAHPIGVRSPCICFFGGSCLRCSDIARGLVTSFLGCYSFIALRYSHGLIGARAGSMSLSSLRSSTCSMLSPPSCSITDPASQTCIIARSRSSYCPTGLVLCTAMCLPPSNHTTANSRARGPTDAGRKSPGVCNIDHVVDPSLALPVASASLHVYGIMASSRPVTGDKAALCLHQGLGRGRGRSAYCIPTPHPRARRAFPIHRPALGPGGGRHRASESSPRAPSELSSPL